MEVFASTPMKQRKPHRFKDYRLAFNVSEEFVHFTFFKNDSTRSHVSERLCKYLSMTEYAMCTKTERPKNR